MELKYQKFQHCPANRGALQLAVHFLIHTIFQQQAPKALQFELLLSAEMKSFEYFKLTIFVVNSIPS